MIMISLSEKVGRNLASRKRAAEFRAWLISQTESVQLDLSGVELLSHSFADELFGKIAEEFGSEFFKNRVVLMGMKDHDRELIRSVVINRMETRKAG